MAKKLAKRSNCKSCKSLLLANEMDLNERHFLKLLSRGGLTVPSAKLADFTADCFAILHYTEDIVRNYQISQVRSAYIKILDRFGPKLDFCCSAHINWGLKFAAKIVINTFFNNKETVASDAARKDAVVDFKKRQRTK